jgi:hypothetical protein
MVSSSYSELVSQQRHPGPRPQNDPRPMSSSHSALPPQQRHAGPKRPPPQSPGESVIPPLSLNPDQAPNPFSAPRRRSTVIGLRPLLQSDGQESESPFLPNSPLLDADDPDEYDAEDLNRYAKLYDPEGDVDEFDGLERVNADILQFAKERAPNSLEVLKKALTPFHRRKIPLPKDRARISKTEASKMKDILSLLKTT